MRRVGLAGTPSGRLSTGGSIATVMTEETVAVVPVHSEADLLRELSAIRGKLDSKLEWDTRISALRRLQGIAQGGAGAYPLFVEHLKGSLRDPLRDQMTDRRSQVRRRLRFVSSSVSFGCVLNESNQE
jgi:hypothetical protein